jgi:hypothetical protein
VHPVLAFACFLAAFVCFVLAAFGYRTERLTLTALGAAFWVFVYLWAAAERL